MWPRKCSTSISEKSLVPGSHPNETGLPPTRDRPLCILLGKTRHAYYDHQKRLQGQCLRDDIILAKVLEVRNELPRVGTLKLHHMLTPVFRSHNMKVGRDYMFDLLGEYGLLVRARRRRP